MEVLQLAREYPVLHCMPSSVAKSSDSVSILSPDLGFESGRTANHLAISRLCLSLQCCNWMLCGLDDDDDTPDDPVIVPVKTQIPVHLLPDSCVRLCSNIIIVHEWIGSKIDKFKNEPEKASKIRVPVFVQTLYIL